MKKLLLATLLFFVPCFLLITFSAAFSENKTGTQSAELNRPAQQREYSQQGAFRHRKNANNIARKLRRAGYKALIVKGITSGGTRIYRVLARKASERNVRTLGLDNEGSPFVLKAATGVRESYDKEEFSLKPGVTVGNAQSKADPVQDPLRSGNGSGTNVDASGSQFPKGSFLVSQAGDSSESPGVGRREEVPVGSRRSYRDIFGRGGSYFHPSLSVTELYTDNAYATKYNKKTNFTTMLSPELWFSSPRVTQRHIVIDDTLNRMPGGLVFTRLNPEVVRRYQTYFLYRADIPLPSSNSPYGNTVSNIGYGRFEYNGNKFSSEVVDQFVKSLETRSTNISTEPGQIDKFYNNLFDASASFDTGNRLRLKLGYSDFLVHYNDERNQFMDRTDNAFSGYIFYKVQPKTAAFLEYRFIDISYDHDSTLDSDEHHFLAGVRWDITAKSQGEVKAGYGIKDFKNSSQNENTYIVEAQIKHRFTPRTSLTVSGFRKTDETNLETYLYAITDEVEVKYDQLFTSKISGVADVMYAHERYKGVVTEGENNPDFEDNIYQATIGLQYEFQKWLSSSIGYIYTRRDSSYYSAYDFVSNTAFFRITGSL